MLIRNLVIIDHPSSISLQRFVHKSEFRLVESSNEEGKAPYFFEENIANQMGAEGNLYDDRSPSIVEQRISAARSNCSENAR
jgi:hypothetical protein